MTSKTALVVDSDSSRALQLKVIFDFIDFGSAHAADCQQWDSTLGGEIPDVVVIGNCGDETQTRMTIDSIIEQCGKVPVLLVSERDNGGRPSGELGERIVTVIEFPVKYRQFMHALHLAEVYQNEQPGGKTRSPELFRSLVGNSRSILQIRKLIQQVADSDANVLILGESGTGKEVVARNLHYYSSRREGPFVPVNCGAIPPDLLESELFGHEKGAFTGAISSRQGRFEMADGGTLFLDEIGDMPLPMQVKILRVLQERIFERVGSNKSTKANVRIVAATHRDLEEEIRKGRFREDLYYRLNVFPIDMPPLRDRVEDIPFLVREIINRLEREHRGSVRLTPAAIAALSQYPWPGNVRELANLMERLVIMFPYGVVDVRDLPEKYRGHLPQGVELEPQVMFDEDLLPAAIAGDELPLARLPRDGIDLKEHLTSLELSLIQQALDDADGVVAHAAKRLNMRRTTLVEKMRKYGLTRYATASEA